MIESTKRIAPFGLRLPEALRERVQAAAKTANRSMNAEIIARLEASFELDEKLSAMHAEEKERAGQLVEVRQRLEKLEAIVNRALDRVIGSDG